MNHNNKNTDDDSEKISKIETDVNLIKEMTLLANENLFIDKLEEAIGKSQNKTRIIFACYNKPKNQTELCNILDIKKGNLSLLIKDLTDHRMIYPTQSGRLKIIQLTFKISKHSLLKLISDIFNEEFALKMENEFLK